MSCCWLVYRPDAEQQYSDLAVHRLPVRIDGAEDAIDLMVFLWS